MSMLPLPSELPGHFRNYTWDAFHAAFGYAPDNYESGFPWIVDLENRFREALVNGYIPSIKLVAEMVLWGGNQRGVLSKLSRGLRDRNNYEQLIRHVVSNLDEPETAVESALAFPGFGLTYGSKLLRFCRPTFYGALDGRIREKLSDQLPNIYDGNRRSMCNGYKIFLSLIHTLQRNLEQEGIQRPAYGLRPQSAYWSATEVEMALYSWATSAL